MKQQIQNFLSKNYNSGNIVSGQIIKVEADSVWVNVGLEELVHIPQKFISDLKCDHLNERETIEFLVSRSISQDNNYQFYLDFELLERIRIEQRINQLLKEDVTIYARVIAAYSSGISIEVESKIFTISNLHLCTNIPNQHLLGTVIPVKIVASYSMEGLVLGFSHRWAVTPDKLYQRWDIVLGKVIQIEPDGAWIDLGVEKLIYVPLEQIVNTSCYPNLSANEVLSLNQSYEFIVDIYSVNNNDYGTVLISFKVLNYARGYNRIQQLYKEDLIFYAEVIDHNDYGIFVIIENFLGFVPHFHIEQKLSFKGLIGRRIPLTIISFIPHGNFYRLIILSHTYALNQLNQDDVELRKVSWDVVDGKVIKIESEGAWIDIGINKLIYISIEKLIYIPIKQMIDIPLEQQTNSLIDKLGLPEEILQVDRQYQFVIQYILDRKDNLDVSLSLAKVHARIIWQRLEQLKKEEVVISALIIKVNNNGSLIVDVEGIHGYVPSTQISDFHLETPREQLMGKKLDLEILEVGDEYRDRFRLSHSLPIKKRSFLD